MNPLLTKTGLPPYDQINASHVESAVKTIIEKGQELLAQAEQAPLGDWEALKAPMGELDLLFEYGWSPIGHLLGVANSDEMRDAHEAALPEVITFVMSISQSPAIYERYCALRDSDGFAEMSSAHQRIVEQAIRGAENSGISLEGQQLERFNEIAQQLSQLSTEFSNNVLDATKAWHMDLTDPSDAEGLPESFRRVSSAAWASAQESDDAAADSEKGPWRVTLDAPSFGPFMEHCQKSSLREKVYRAYVTRASAGEQNNQPLIEKILKLRKEKCDLLGFDHFAALSLSTKMAEGVEAVEKMFADLLAASLESGKKELAEVNEFANSKGHDGELKHWDIGFWAERLREDRFAFTDEELRPYFSFEPVLDGLFALCNRMFGITMKAADGKAPIWHDDVRYFEVFGEAGEQIAAFYLDPYVRPENKRPGAWMADCIQRCKTDQETRIPVAHMVCNSTPPVGDTPSLMTFREVETLFHEFGHGLQHMLTTVDLRDVSGISGVEWDAVELPSQFMENWCYHRETLLGMAKHYQTGETLPDDLFEKICKARTYRAASQMLRQIQFGMTDIELHSRFDPAGSKTAFDVYEQIAAVTSPMPPFADNKFLCAFSHIFAGGYAAGYYSYKWAEVLSADAFAAFEDAGLEDEAAVAKIGRKFRDTILAQGGSRHPMEIYEEFRGRKPTVDALLRHCGLQA